MMLWLLAQTKMVSAIVPGVRDVFNTAGDKMNWSHWLITMAMSLLPLIVHEIVILVKFIIKKTKHNKED